MRSPLQPTRSVDAEAAGSAAVVAEEEKASAPSRKAERERVAEDEDSTPASDCVKGMGSAATLLGSEKEPSTTEPVAS